MLGTAQKINTKNYPHPTGGGGGGVEVLGVANSKAREMSLTVDKWLHYSNHPVGSFRGQHFEVT